MMRQILLLCSILALSSAQSIEAKRKGRQEWIGHLETTTDCSFSVSGVNDPLATTGGTKSMADKLGLCNFTLSGAADGVYPFRRGLASLASWLGGPTVDASNSSDGGYVFFETSSLSVQQLPGIQSKAWLKTPVYQPTGPNGLCLKFSYNMQGVSAAQLKVLRVQMVPTEARTAAGSQLIVNSILVPTVPASARVRMPEGAFASPWTPYRSLFPSAGLNQSVIDLGAGAAANWQEVVDEVWLSSDSTHGKWLQGHVTYSSPYPHAFIFEAIPELSHLQYRGHVAIDDVEFNQGPCDFECEFNSDFCQWTNEVGPDVKADFKWSLSRGSLWTHTGPVKDQLSSTTNFNFGGYAFIDSHHPHFPGSRAILVSKSIPETTNRGPICFNFWVHMFGAGIGQLRLLQKSTSNSSIGETEEIWRLADSGPRDTWYRAQVTLASNVPFNVHLEATVGESGYGDIAVDSFRVQNGPCPLQPERAVYNTLPGNRGSGADCTFHQSACSWVATNSHPGIASMWTKSSGDVFAGRPEGHAQQNVLEAHSAASVNPYMSFDTWQNGHRPASRGFLSSQLESGRMSPQCLSFWAYMAASSLSQPRIGALEIVLFEPNTTSKNASTGSTPVVSTTLWRMENHQQEKWFFSQVSFVAGRGGYISFVGIRGDGVRGVLAIDDVTLYRGSCPTIPAEASVSPLDCSFDLNMCGWTVDSRTVMESTTEEALDSITTTPSTTTTALFRQNLPDGMISISSTSTTAIPEEEESLPASTTTESELESTTMMVDFLLPAGTETTEGADLSTAAVTTEDVTVTSTTNAPSTTEAILSTTEKSEPSTTTTTTSSTTTTKPIKQSTQRGVSGPFDEITSYGPGNTIEVVSTSRNGATKSIIISQPGRIISTSSGNRNRRSWIGYNKPPQITQRDSRIVHLRKDETAWQRPLPVPHWLRGRNPTPSSSSSESQMDSRAQITAFRPLNFHSQTVQQPSKLFGIQPSIRPSSSFSANNNINGPFPPRTVAAPAENSTGLPPVSDETISAALSDKKWILASAGPLGSLNRIRDHTFQLAEGGYVFMESGRLPVVSRLFSPVFHTNTSQCLSFFFAMTSGKDQNVTLTVYRTDNNNGTSLTELWRVTSGALDRSEIRYGVKTQWIPARVPIPSVNMGNQTIVIEGSCNDGGIALDDIRLQPITCSIRP